MNQTHLPLRLTGGLALLMTCCATASAAETAAGDQPIEEIVVRGTYTTNDKLDSATGLGLSILETPQSVSVMTFERLQDQNLRSLTDVVIHAAGVSAKELDSSRYSFSARGFAIDNYQIDGVPLQWTAGGDAGETQTDTSLYERIEIVRGATGLLTGSGNPSASINLVRKHANASEFMGFVSVGAGSWDTYDATVDIAGRLIPSGRVRGRAVVTYEDGDSYTDLLGNEKQVYYAVVDADLTERTLLRVGGSHQDNEPRASTWGGLPTWYADGSRTNWRRSKTIGADWTYWASTNDNAFVNLIHDFDNGWRAQVNYNYAQNDAELNLLYMYGQPDQDTGLGLIPFPYRSDTTREQHAIDLHISGTYPLFGRAHEVSFGYMDQQMDDITYFFPESNVAPVGDFNDWDGSYPEPDYGARLTDIDVEVDQSGVYAATRLNVTDAAKVIVGGRVADWERQGMVYDAGQSYGDTGVVIPYAGVLYDVTDNHTVYASYTEIFKPQNARDRFGDYLDPVVGEGYELGLKSTFFSGGLYTVVTAFRIDQDNVAQPDTGYLIPGTIFEASRAAQGTRSEGFEFEVVGEPTSGWNVSLSATWFTAEDAEGEDVNTDQPREMVKLFTTYELPGRWSALTVGGGINWEGDNYSATVNPVSGLPERLEQDSYTLVSLMARYDFSDNTSLQVNADNLLDEAYHSQIGFYNQLAFGAPRNVRASFKYRF